LGNSQRLTALTTQFSTCASFMLVLCMTDVNGPFNSTDNPTAARFHGSTGKLTCQTPLPALSPSAADGERVSETDRRQHLAERIPGSHIRPTAGPAISLLVRGCVR
jgi:hypothetical protein